MAALVLLDEGFETVEAMFPVDILTRGGVKVTLAAADATEQISGQKVTVKCAKLADVKSEEFDVVILPGGMPNAKLLGENTRVVELVKTFLAASNKWVAAICASPALVLAKNNLLPAGCPATCYPAPDFDALMGDHLRKDAVVTAVEHKIITARGPGAAAAFGLAILEHLKGSDAAKKVADAMLL